MVKKQPPPQATSGGVTHATQKTANSSVTHQTVSIDALRPHPRNYRKHPESQIARLSASLARFSQVRSIVVQQGADGRYLLVAGHGLAEAAKREGYVTLEADVIPAHWTDAQVTGYLVADNESSREAEDDLTALAAMLEEQRNAGYHLESLGFSDDDLTALLAQLADEQLAQGSERDVDDPDGGGDDFDTTPDDGPTRSQPGDIWALGSHRLLCGDSTKREDVARLMAGETAQTLVYDPPWDAAIDWRNSDYSSVLVFCDGRRLGNAVTRFGAPVWTFVWDCVSCWYTPNRPLQRMKLALWYGDLTTYQFDGAHYGDAGEIRTVWNTRGSYTFTPDERGKHLADVYSDPITKLHAESEHHHAKPVGWIALLLANCTNGLIYDPFAGGGTTLIAAERLNRSCIACEIEPSYCDVILRRWEAETGCEAVLLERIERIEQANGPQIEVHA